MYDSSGQRVLITGGNTGLGAGVARGFLAARADLVIAGIEDDVSEVSQSWTQEFARPVTGLTCDITSAKDRARLAAAAGTLDVLINNAGLELITPITDLRQTSTRPSPGLLRSTWWVRSRSFGRFCYI